MHTSDARAFGVGARVRVALSGACASPHAPDEDGRVGTVTALLPDRTHAHEVAFDEPIYLGPDGRGRRPCYDSMHFAGAELVAERADDAAG